MNLAYVQQKEADTRSVDDNQPIDQGMALSAWRSLSGVLALHPDSIAALEARAVAAVAAGNAEGALMDCDAALRSVHQRQGGREGSVPQSQQALVASIRGTRAFVQQSMENYKEASEDVQAVRQADSSAQHGIFMQGWMALRGKEWEAAIALFDECIRRQPHHTPALLNRGVCHHMRPKGAGLEQAEADFTTVLELAAGDYNAYFNRAVVRHALGYLALAEEDCTKAIGLLPLDARGRLLRMQVIRDQATYHDRADLDGELKDRLKEVLEDFRQALRLDEELASTFLRA